MFIQYLQVQNNAAIVLSHWHGRRRIFQLCAKTGEGKREGGELGPSQGGQKHPWTPTLIYALMMRLWKVLTLITDFLAWSVNSALESSWLGTNPFQMCCFWKTKKEYIHIKKKKPNKIFQGNWDDAVVRASASYRAGLGSFLRPDVTCGPCKPSGFFPVFLHPQN